MAVAAFSADRVVLTYAFSKRIVTVFVLRTPLWAEANLLLVGLGWSFLILFVAS
jgi:hypothetical protein